MQLRVRPGFRSRPASVLDFLVAVYVIASVASPWWISVPPAHLQETFGFESPASWLVVVALFNAMFIEARAAVDPARQLEPWAGVYSALHAAFYFASTDSPDPAQFAEYGRCGNVPPPIPRSPEWILLALAALLWMLSIAATAWQRRRSLQKEIVWD